MSRRFLPIILIPLLLMRRAAFGQDAVPSTSAVRTLKEAYANALQNSERIAISEQAVRGAEALYRQTLGLSFPSIALRHETLWQDHPGPGVESQGMIRLAKTDLSGYRELAALKAGKSALRREKFSKQRVEQLLLRDIAGAFFGWLQAKENVTSTKRLTELAESRLRELHERVRVGRSRQVESLDQDFQIVSLRSQMEETVRVMEARADLVNFLIGARVSDSAADTSDFLTAQQPLQMYLARVNTRPDVQAAESNKELAQSSVRVARSQYFPQLGILANYYTYRPNVREDIKWDASLNVGLPLWTWGARKGSLDAAKAVFHQTEKELQATSRQAELDVQNAYRDLVSARKQLEFQQRAVDLARRSYELQVRDDRRGLVTSLDVLESLNRLNNAELALNNARLLARLAALNLEIAAGAHPEEILK